MELLRHIHRRAISPGTQRFQRAGVAADAFLP